MSDNIIEKTGIAAVIAFFILIAFAVYNRHFDHRDTILRNYATCIEQTAKAQGYTGNVHGQEAWDLFASNCR